MVADRAALIIERLGREVTVVAREAVLNGAAEGGLIGLIEPGDRIEIDIPQRRLDLAVAEEELARRRAAMAARGAAAWRPAEQRPRKVSTALRAYAAMATSAAKGAVRSVPD